MLLLADGFADYRKRSYETYSLDPICFVSSPEYAYRSMLKYTNAEIKLITDVNIHLIIEKGIQGGRCEPMFLKAEANNEYVSPNFDKNKDTESYLVSSDANSLYPTAMSMKLPCREFKYINDISIFTTEYILNLDKNGDYFYVFVVDINYLLELYDEHEEFLLLCDQEIPPKDNVKKIMSTLYNKKIML